MYVVPGFSNATLNASTGFGAGQLYVNGGNFTTAMVAAAGNGDVILAGNYGSVAATATGTGSLYLNGVNASADLTLAGVANAYVASSNASLSITGSSSGINTVSYSNGACRVTSPFIFSSPCRAVPYVIVPPPTPTWTCGLKTAGNFTCLAGGESFTTSASGATTISSGPSTRTSASIGGARAVKRPFPRSCMWSLMAGRRHLHPLVHDTLLFLSSCLNCRWPGLGDPLGLPVWQLLSEPVRAGHFHLLQCQRRSLWLRCDERGRAMHMGRTRQLQQMLEPLSILLFATTLCTG